MKHLLPVVPKYFKTNLHTHTNISDGHMTPEEIVERYKDAGYQVLCITDHNVIVDHSDKSTEDFLLLTGVEVNINDEHYTPTKGFRGQTYHMNFIAKDPHNLWQPVNVIRKRPTAAPYEDLVECENMPKVYDVDAVNAMIAKGNEKGFLVMYNHPTWSNQNYLDYAPLKGLWGMELRNSECCYIGVDENNARVYSDLLRLGNRLFPTGTDDTHSARALFGAWIMVGAEKLDYPTVIEALEKGDFYMSCGPEIKSLSLDGDFLEIECSDAQKIFVESHTRTSRLEQSEPGTVLNHARIDLSKFFRFCEEFPNEKAYIRVTVTAPDGTYAATRAYWVDEL